MSALPDAAVPHPPRQRRSRESLERVLQAGVELLGETDYDGFTLGELSRRATVSVGSVGAEGSSWKERQTISTPSAWSKEPSAFSSRRLPM